MRGLDTGLTIFQARLFHTGEGVKGHRSYARSSPRALIRQIRSVKDKGDFWRGKCPPRTELRFGTNDGCHGRVTGSGCTPGVLWRHVKTAPLASHECIHLQRVDRTWIYAESLVPRERSQEKGGIDD